MAMMQGLTSAIVNPNDLRLMETIKSCDIFKNNELYPTPIWTSDFPSSIGGSLPVFGRELCHFVPERKMAAFAAERHFGTHISNSIFQEGIYERIN